MAIQDMFNKSTEEQKAKPLGCKSPEEGPGLADEQLDHVSGGSRYYIRRSGYCRQCGKYDILVINDLCKSCADAEAGD